MVPRPRPDPDPALLTTLATWLADAAAGKLTGVTLAGVRPDQSIVTEFWATNAHDLLAVVTILQARILASLRPSE